MLQFRTDRIKIGDLLLSFAWFAAFGVLVDVLKKMDCGRPFDWGHITDGGVCSRWKAVEAFSFVSAILWLVSTIVVCYPFARILFLRLYFRLAIDTKR